MRLWVVAALLVLPSVSRADYVGERKSLTLQPLPGMGLLRVYLGKHADNECPSVEVCMQRFGTPVRRERVSTDEERVVWHGKKTLWVGTGEANVSAGPERRETRVRGGEVVDEIEIVQIVEFGLPWKPDVGVEKRCEGWGNESMGDCTGVEPYGRVPDMPRATKQPFDFSCTKGEASAAVGTKTREPIDADQFAAATENALRELARTSRVDVDRKLDGPPMPSTFALGHDPFKNSRDEAAIQKSLCRTGRRFSVIARGHHVGELAVGVCDRTSELTPKAVCDAKANAGTVLSAFGVSPDVLKASGGHPARETRDGRQLDYFPVMLTGHGILTFPTIVVTEPDARDAVIVQWDPHGNCRPGDEPFCGGDLRRILSDLAMRVAWRYLPAPR